MIANVSVSLHCPLQQSAAHTDTHSYLLFGVADQLLLRLDEANGGNRACVPAERTHRLWVHTRVPQQDLMINTCRGYNQICRIRRGTAFKFMKPFRFSPQFNVQLGIWQLWCVFIPLWVFVRPLIWYKFAYIQIKLIWQGKCDHLLNYN